ncbi:hypothetical protein [Hominifimenecus sp. rT4P-3]|uniref:hypothetical protein n=1 Tax=Hominifimenecus sp. rT4P-3 TaxID=3242979 RepID=UPI003DA39238
MSVDNGIYILAAKDQYRVACAQGIDQIYWSFSEGYCGGRVVPTRAMEVWGNLPHTHDAKTAIRVAERFRRKMDICESGICIIPLETTWRTLVREAKDYAEQELCYLEENDWGFEVNRKLLWEIQCGRIH